MGLVYVGKKTWLGLFDEMDMIWGGFNELKWIFESNNKFIFIMFKSIKFILLTKSKAINYNS